MDGKRATGRAAEIPAGVLSPTEALELLRRELAGDEETPEPGFRTRAAWAEAWGLSQPRTRDILIAGVRAGKARMRKYRIKTEAGIRPVPHYAVTGMRRPTIASLRGLAESWRNTLGLGDWTLYVTWGRPISGREPDPKNREMAADCDGNAWWYTEDASAIILIHPRCTAPEETLIHELLHVRLEGHREMPHDYDAMYERALNAIAAALLKKGV